MHKLSACDAQSARDSRQHAAHLESVIEATREDTRAVVAHSEQEVARLCARLEKFEKLAAIGEGGERDNAEAMAAQARAKLEELGYSAMSKK